MPRRRDSQRSKAYRAENLLPERWTDDFASLDEVRAYLNHVAGSAFVQRHWPRRLARVVFIPRRGSGADANPFLGRIRWGHRCRRSRLVALHELAHLLAPDDARHGAAWAAIYLALTRRFLGADVARRLRVNFIALGVKHRKPSPRRPLTAEQRAILTARLTAARLARVAGGCA